MRVLFVTPYVPSVIKSRPYNLIKQLSRDHEVTLVSLVHGREEHKALHEISDYCTHVYPVAMDRNESLKNCARTLLTKVPVQAASTCMSSFSRIVNGLVKKRKYDVVHVEHIRGAHLASHIEQVPKVYDSVDCVTLLLHQFLAATRNPLAWFLTFEEWSKMRVYEAMMSQKFDKVITSTGDDKEALEKLIWQRIKNHIETAPGRETKDPAQDQDEWRKTRHLIEMAQDQRLESLQSGRSKISVIPNGVDVEYFKPQEDVEEQKDLLVFAGNMSSPSNVRAVHNLCDDIFPTIRSHRKDVKLKIVGNDPASSIVRLGRQPGVEVTGYVEDIRPHIAEASVVVFPDTRLRSCMLKSMAMGKSVVTTAKDFSETNIGEQVVLTASKPGEFADEVLHLLNDEALKRSIGEHAARFVKENYNWQSLTRRLEDVYEEARLFFSWRKLAGASSGGW